MRAVRNINDTGRTVAVTVHQPSTLVFEVTNSFELIEACCREVTCFVARHIVGRASVCPCGHYGQMQVGPSCYVSFAIAATAQCGALQVLRASKQQFRVCLPCLARACTAQDG